VMVRSDLRKLGKNSPPQLQWKPTRKSSERFWKRSLQLSKSDNEPCPCHQMHLAETGNSNNVTATAFIVNLHPEVTNAAGAGVAADTGKVHTPTMTLKNAALLALIGTILITVLLVWTFVFDVVNVLRGLVPALTLFSSFIYAFACFTVAVFFYVFHRAQS